MMLSGLSLGFGGMNRTVRVFGWRVNRIQLERSQADIADIMPLTGGYKNRKILASFHFETQVIGRIAHYHPGLALFDPQKLVMIIVHLGPDVFTGLQTHQRHL